MDTTTYKRMTNNQFYERKVRLVRTISNGHYEFPKDTILTIEKKQGGFELISDHCHHCNIRHRISKVPPEDVELLEDEETLEKDKVIQFPILISRDANDDLIWCLRYPTEKNRYSDVWFSASWESGGEQLAFPREIPIWLDGYMGRSGKHYFDIGTENLVDEAWKALRSNAEVPFGKRSFIILLTED